MAIWPYDHITAIGPYGYMALNLVNISVKELNWLDLLVRNESQNGPTVNFPLYLLEFPLKTQKWVAPPNKSFTNPEFLW